jgi:hypothetical protein
VEGTLESLEIEGSNIANKTAVMNVRDLYFLRFKKEHYEYVDHLLEKAGLANRSFSVIHWRAELPGLDYIRCAEDIIRARAQMNTNTSFVLMSSLNTRKDYMWLGAKRASENGTSSPDDALTLLFDSGFLKLDNIIKEDSVRDPGLLAVWDLIIAMKAKQFATCTKDCWKFCSKCNWRGSFSEFALSLRKMEGKSKESMACWPSKE